MEEQHERLFDLIESRSFEELSNEERAFVLSHLTEAEYTLQRKVIASAPELTYEDEEPIPLQIRETNIPFLKRSIPLYQVLIGAACLVLIFFAAGNRNDLSINWRFLTQPVTVSLNNQSASLQVIHDTIIKEVPVFHSSSDIIRDTIVLVQTITQPPAKRLLEASSQFNYPQLSEKLLESKGLSFKEDQTARFLPTIDLVSTMK